MSCTADGRGCYIPISHYLLVVGLLMLPLVIATFNFTLQIVDCDWMLCWMVHGASALFSMSLLYWVSQAVFKYCCLCPRICTLPPNTHSVACVLTCFGRCALPSGTTAAATTTTRCSGTAWHLVCPLPPLIPITTLMCEAVGSVKHEPTGALKEAIGVSGIYLPSAAAPALVSPLVRCSIQVANFDNCVQPTPRPSLSTLALPHL